MIKFIMRLIVTVIVIPFGIIMIPILTISFKGEVVRATKHIYRDIKAIWK